MMSMARGRAHSMGPRANHPRKLRIQAYRYRHFLGAKIQSREGNSPDRTLRSLSNHLVEKSESSDETRRWAWKQPSFEESVIAHCSGTFCQSGKVLVTRPGDIRSENADMSNEKSCEKHDRLPVEGFLRSVNLRRVNRS
ncbi:UNVERIFIED_CONTAM: hypothetical protein Slati_4580900 [Sesamum latifolium]|uniref:Uncharacterized protein n=1 Tax=Sesamum latifolium TaxID=2727402 RepID=A0AAW2S573_9LAMI